MTISATNGVTAVLIKTSSPGTPTGETPVGGNGFTVTGIPSEYLGKYVAGWGETGAYRIIVGSATPPTLTSSSAIIPGVLIQGSTVTLPLWLLSNDQTTSTSYVGSDTVSYFAIGISPYSSFGSNKDEVGISFSNVTFINGSATRAVSQGTIDGTVSGDGSLTVTGLPVDAVTGQYVSVYGEGTLTSWDGTSRHVRITVSGGSTTIPLVEPDVHGAFTGTGLYSFYIHVYDEDDYDQLAGMNYTNVTFTNGKGTVDWNSGWR
jgi:hypothetical protein